MKWTILVLRDIGGYGRARFSQLAKVLPSIPPKILAARLKQLEQEGLHKEACREEHSPEDH
jgi:DNA-binding HxlR family transcriptional regulator